MPEVTQQQWAEPELLSLPLLPLLSSLFFFFTPATPHPTLGSRAQAPWWVQLCLRRPAPQVGDRWPWSSISVDGGKRQEEECAGNQPRLRELPTVGWSPPRRGHHTHTHTHTQSLPDGAQQHQETRCVPSTRRSSQRGPPKGKRKRLAVRASPARGSAAPLPTSRGGTVKAGRSLGRGQC